MGGRRKITPGSFTRLDPEASSHRLCASCRRWLKAARFDERSGEQCSVCALDETRRKQAPPRNVELIIPAPPGAPVCFACPREGLFLIPRDGLRACAPHLKQSAKERAS